MLAFVLVLFISGLYLTVTVDNYHVSMCNRVLSPLLRLTGLFRVRKITNIILFVNINYALEEYLGII